MVEFSRTSMVRRVARLRTSLHCTKGLCDWPYPVSKSPCRVILQEAPSHVKKNAPMLHFQKIRLMDAISEKKLFG